MKKLSTVAMIALCVLFSGCATYHTSPLNSLSSEILIMSSYHEGSEVLAGAVAFNKAACKKYLGRNIISKGYQPLQLYIQNNSDKNYIFSLNRISVPCARPEEIASKIYTKKVGGTLVCAAASLLTGAVLMSPTAADGLFTVSTALHNAGSTDADKSFNNTLFDKTAHDQVIFRHSHFNKLLFVPVDNFQQTISVTLIEQDSKQEKSFNISVGNGSY